MLDETLVVFATEFGRTPGSQNGDGRDHHIFGFTIWMAGGGLKRGVVHGATDEIGFHAVENRALHHRCPCHNSQTAWSRLSKARGSRPKTP